MTQHGHTKETTNENINDFEISKKAMSLTLQLPLMSRMNILSVLVSRVIFHITRFDFVLCISNCKNGILCCPHALVFPMNSIIMSFLLMKPKPIKIDNWRRNNWDRKDSTANQQTNKPTWIIDPIDGTTNFASGLSLSYVSIGFCLKGKPYMGVIYTPMANKHYVAMNGRGAYRNGVRLLGCTGEKAGKTLSKAVVCFEFGYARTQEGIDNMVNAMRRLLEHGVCTTCTLGSRVLDLCYVGYKGMGVVYTGMAEEDWKLWDYF